MVRALRLTMILGAALAPACMAGSVPDGSGFSPPLDAGSKPVRDTTPPVVERLPLDVGGVYDPATQRLGSLNCSLVSDRPASVEMGCFRGFGSGAPDPAPGVTFVTGAGVRIKAVTPGTVERVVFVAHDHLTHSDMFLIVTRASPTSVFAVAYRHVKDVGVRVGNPVVTGQVLGRSGDYFDLAHGRVMLSILRTQVYRQHLCPERFIRPEARDAFRRVLEANREAWPAYADAELCRGVSVFCHADGCLDAPPELTYGDLEAGQSIYRSACASCHGIDGGGGVGPPLRPDANVLCESCDGHRALSARTALDMPPEGRCVDRCADDVAAFIRVGFGWR